MSQALDDYTRAFRALEQFRFDHLGVLVQLEGLRDDLQEAEDQLKDFARQNGPEENDTLVVKVNAAPKKRIWNARKLLGILPWLDQVPGIISLAVDDKALQLQLRASRIDEAIIADALTVTEGTAAVSIRVKIPEVKRAEVA